MSEIEGKEEKVGEKTQATEPPVSPAIAIDYLSQKFFGYLYLILVRGQADRHGLMTTQLPDETSFKL